MMADRLYASWSSGKDSAWMVHAVRNDRRYELVGLLTTVNETHGRVAMHAVRTELLEMQAAALRLPLLTVPIPSPCSNDEYEAAMQAAVGKLKAEGVTHVAFGDLLLEDVRQYREAQMDKAGLASVFPLWKRDIAALAHEMVQGGLKAIITCVDPKQLPRDFAGREFDGQFLADLPDGVDPCGENGEFHTFVYDGLMFGEPIRVQRGEVVEREGFVFADLIPVR